MLAGATNDKHVRLLTAFWASRRPLHLLWHHGRLLLRCRGKWGKASAEEVQEAKDAGKPYCYRFRSPKVSLRAVLLAVLILETDSGGSVGADGGARGSSKGGSGSKGSSGRVC